jgi:hypothetical protein
MWLYVQTRPSKFVRKACPKCESYPRDRILWLILSYLQSLRHTENLKILEIGGAARSHWWKKSHYGYANADLKCKVNETVDLTVNRGRICRRPKDLDVAIISHVFGEILSCATRLRMAKEASEATKESGILILFEDIDLGTVEHRKLGNREFFHKMRLGNSILLELRCAGWRPTVIEKLPKNSILGESELPFILASKGELSIDVIALLSNLADVPDSGQRPSS